MQIFNNFKYQSLAVFITIGLYSLLTSCGNAERDMKKNWDAGPVEEISHSGHFRGYTAVYTINWIDETIERSEKTYRVYEKDNGEFTIDYDDETYILQEAERPITVDSYMTLEWKIDYNHYIEEIPTSY